MGRSLIAAWLFASLFLSCERGNTDVTLLDPQTHGSYAGSAFWSGNNFPQWVNGDILEDTAGDSSVTPGKDTAGGEDTGEPACQGSAAYCDCVGTFKPWDKAEEYCQCKEGIASGADYSCECCWAAFDEATPDDLAAWASGNNQSYCLGSYYESTPDGGCQE